MKVAKGANVVSHPIVDFSLTEQRVFLSMLRKSLLCVCVCILSLILIIDRLIVRKYELSLPKDTIHADGIVTHGMPVSAPLNMQITYKSRY